MKSKPVSAALALVRGDGAARQVLLVHPGGPFWAKKDLGSWSLPKGLIEPGEDPVVAALREYAEETGFSAPPPPHVPLGQIVQKSGKRVIGFAARGEVDPAAMKSNEIDIEWPPRTGKTLRIPECDRAAFFGREAALEKILEGQRPLIEKAFEIEL